MNPAELPSAIVALPPQRYAVLDGAQFDGLADALAAHGLVAQPLYLEGADPAAVASGPHLLHLASRAALERVLELIGDRPAAVFWSWDLGTESLYRHLRTLNVAQIARVHTPSGPDDYQTVLFRHWDPNVLAVMLAVMTPDQQRSLLGDSAGITFFAPKVGAIRTVRSAHAPVQ